MGARRAVGGSAKSAPNPTTSADAWCIPRAPAFQISIEVKFEGLVTPGWNQYRPRTLARRRSQAAPRAGGRQPLTYSRTVRCDGRAKSTSPHAPVYDCYSLAVRTITVRQNAVVHANVLEAFDGRKWRAWQNRLDVARRRNVVHHGRCWLAWHNRREQRLGLEVSDAA